MPQCQCNLRQQPAGHQAPHTGWGQPDSLPIRTRLQSSASSFSLQQWCHDLGKHTLFSSKPQPWSLIQALPCTCTCSAACLLRISSTISTLCVSCPCPSNADFQQQVFLALLQQYWHGREKHQYVGVAHFAEAFRRTMGKESVEYLQTPYQPPNDQCMKALQTRTYALPGRLHM